MQHKTAYSLTSQCIKAGRRALTLIELLIVVSIIAVLVFIAMPIYGNLRSSSNQGKCANNMRQMAGASITFAADHGALPPYNRVGKYWYLFLMHENLVGGQYGRGPLPNENVNNVKEMKTVYHCPDNPGRVAHWWTPNYAYNRALGDAKLGNIVEPGKVIMYADAGYRQQGPQHYYANFPADAGPPDVCCYTTDYTGASFDWTRSLFFKAHGKRANVVFVDGHLEALTREEVETRGANRSLLWSRDNQPINNDQSPNFW